LSGCGLTPSKEFRNDSHIVFCFLGVCHVDQRDAGHGRVPPDSKLDANDSVTNVSGI